LDWWFVVAGFYGDGSDVLCSVSLLVSWVTVMLLLFVSVVLFDSWWCYWWIFRDWKF
jgi:hypothetical protein